MFIIHNDLLSFFGAIYHYIHIRSLKKRERERGKLDPVNFRKDFWIVIRHREKNWPKADRCGTNCGFSSLLIFKVANSEFLVLPCRRQERRPGNEDGSLDTWYKTAMLLGRKKHTVTEKQKSSYH